MMGEECSLPQDVTTDELRTNREHDVAPHPFTTWVRDTLDALEVALDKKCCTVIGRGTSAWLYILAERMVCHHSLLDCVPIAVSPDYTASAAFLITAWILDFTTSTYCDCS